MSEHEGSLQSDPGQSISGTMDLVSQAARQGAADASEAAARTIDAAGRFLNRFVYTTCYTVSYGVVFPSVLLARAIPRQNAAVRGLMEGAEAARRKVSEIYEAAGEVSGPAPQAALAHG